MSPMFHKEEKKKFDFSVHLCYYLLPLIISHILKFRIYILNVAINIPSKAKLLFNDYFNFYLGGGAWKKDPIIHILYTYLQNVHAFRKHLKN